MQFDTGQVGDNVFGLVPFAWPMSDWSAPLCGTNAEYVCVHAVRNPLSVRARPFC
jgi:hypothetical protein